MFRNVKEINYQAVHDYVLQPYPGKVALFRSSERCAINRNEDLSGWDRFATEVDFYRVPGNHTTMVEKPHVRVLAEQLSIYLSKALVDSPHFVKLGTIS